MNYEIKKKDNNFEVINESGEVLGTHPVREDALSQVRTLYANEGMSNVSLKFVPESWKITESGVSKEGFKWLNIGGTALVEGISKNKNIYAIENLKENNSREFKWLFGHPDEPEEHIVGLGKLNLQENKLEHEGKIRNTAKHPDVVEAVQDKFLGPSIHASCKKVIKTQEGYKIEGLSIDGIGLVAFQGVEQASIDYAITESVDKRLNELMESFKEEDENITKTGEVKMEEENKPVPPVEPVEKPTEEQPKPQENLELKAVLEELKKANERLAQLEKVAEKKTEAVAVVEEAPAVESIYAVNEGDMSLSTKAYADFNKTLRERVR